MSFFLSLPRYQKKSIFLLQTGTFLEYFDLMLYVHMAVFLNEIFFPQSSGFSASLLGAFALCSTFVFRPFGAMIFGYIGDHVGRKETIVVTNMLMACSCITMGFMPTYETMGITAAWVITICRALQGMSSMGEVVGAGVYLTETIPRPARYPAVAWLEVSASMGGMAALGIANLVFALSLNWRFVFWFGGSIALIGSVARATLRETPEFLKNKGKPTYILPKKSDYKTLWALFFVSCSDPVWFYFIYIYCSDVLRESFNYTPYALIQNSFMVSIAFVVANIFFARLCHRIYPLKIMRFFLTVTSITVIGAPYLLSHASASWQIMVLQMLVGCFQLSDFPGTAIFYRHIPVLRRMTFVSMGNALARAFMFVVVSFGLVSLNYWLGHWGILLIMIPTLASFAWALKHFEKLDLPYKDIADDPDAVDEEEVPPAALPQAA